MTLTPGARLGPYEVLGLLGHGGMGEVYRARDTKLDREVAIKVLPELFAADPERLRRFDREAKTLAAFNHQNIAQVHGVLEQPAALVMELVDGEDLASRLARGPIAIEEAMAMARQIAEGLEAAHERNIIHRDLKPANVKVRQDGVVKVLDFGLAKATATDGAASGVADFSPSDSPTFASPATTQMGVILGTAAYMAPEQTKGKALDKRADIWAFGCVLYEMLTARRAFDGESGSEIIAAVLRSEPDLTHLPADLPSPLRRLIQRCLEKDPRQRLRDIGEARIALGTPVAADVPAVVATKRTPSALSAAAWLAGGVLVGGAVVWFATGRSSATPAASSPEFLLKRLTELPGAEMSPDISPDGRQVLFTSEAAGNRDIYLLRVGGAQPINLTARSAANDEQATFSPDGEHIAFRSEREGGGLFVMGATGESVRRLTTGGFDPAWSPDGKQLAYSTEGVIDPHARNTRAELWTVEIASGKTTRLLEGDAVQPAWSPDGRRIAYWANTGGQRDIWIVDAAGGTPAAVTHDAATDWSPEWSPDGAWLYFSSDRGGTMNLWRVAMDRNSGSASAPQAVTSSFTGVGYARFAADGQRLTVMAYTRSYELGLAPFDSASGKVGPETTVRSSSLGWCSASPSADWLACTSRGAQEDIVLMRPDGSETVRLTDDVAKDRNPSWSPDGSRIGFMSSRSGEWELWSVRADGSDLRQMTDLRADTSVAVWSPDGKQAVTSSVTRPPTGLWFFDTSAPATRQNAKFFKSPPPEVFTAENWSPDGKRIAGYLQDGGGYPRTIAYWDVATGTVRPLHVSLPPRWDFAFVNGGWLPGSRRLLVLSDRGLLIVDSDTSQTTPVPLKPGVRHDLTAGGRTLMVERLLYDADVWLMEVKR